MSSRLPVPNSNPIPHIALGLAIVFVMFGGLVTWAAWAPLDGAVIAPAVMTVHSKHKTIQHFDGGIVAGIMVKDGDYVEQGDLLIRLDATRAEANLAVIDGQLTVLRARASRLRAERENLETVVFDDALLAKADDPNVTEITRAEVELFEARRASIRGEVDILTEQIEQLKNQIGGIQAQLQSKSRQIKLIQEEVSDVGKLYKQGHARKTRLLALRRTREQLKGERGEHIADIASAKNSIGEAELQIIQVQRNFRQEVVNELHQVQAEIFDLEERRVAAADVLRRVEIRAPRAGTVVGMEVHTVGGVIRPGQPILDIVPRGDELVVEAKVAPKDIDKVTHGLPAVIRLSAFNVRTTPELDGTVIAVSADRLIDESSGHPYFLVALRITADELRKLRDFKVLPGMPAEVFIKTGERTAISYLIKPLADGLAHTFAED